MTKTWLSRVGFLLLIALPGQIRAQSAEEMARTLQDPLANIAAIMTDNAVNFKAGDEEVSGYNFQLQPVYAIPFEKFNLIPRAVVPIVGVPGGAYWPPLHGPTKPADNVEWGFSDAMLQTFLSPKSERSWKFGFGPQFSFKTRSSDAQAGAGNGVGVGAVIVGSLSEDISFSGLVNQHWSYDGDFNTFTLQPMLFYNLSFWTGSSIHYNNSIAYNAKGPSGNQWTVPLGLGVSKTLDVGGGHGVDVMLGWYKMIESPQGGPSSQLKFGLTWIIPR